MTNILSLTDNQLELIKSLLEPSIVRDDETGEPDSIQSDPLAAAIMTQIDRQRALDRKPSLFLSLYETRMCYGGPAIITIEGVPGILADTHRPYYC